MATIPDHPQHTETVALWLIRSRRSCPPPRIRPAPVRLTAAFATAFALLLFAAGPAAASPARPATGPDRPFVTPETSPGAGATASAGRICPMLRAQARRGNSQVGFQVRNLTTGREICALNAGAMRSLASNTKLFTTATALARFGPGHRFRTRVYASGRLDRDGTLHGSLYLKGGGDPALGTKPFIARYFGGGGTSIAPLAAGVRKAGIKRVTGRLFGDDSVFDRVRGVADSGYATSPWIGPLSGLSMNAGFTGESLSRFSPDPARLATVTLARQLRRKGVRIRPDVAMRATPKANRRLVARQFSPGLAWNVRVTNLNSNNFFAEMLVKNLGAAFRGQGSTRLGAGVVRQYAASLGVKVRPLDGSGLTRGNRSSAGGVVRLLMRARHEPGARAFLRSLPVAGRDGTLASRMRGSAAAGRCHAKTGTLTGVSALSGYCFNRSGRRYVFSILMNGVSDSYTARLAQDRIAALIAGL